MKIIFELSVVLFLAASIEIVAACKRDSPNGCSIPKLLGWAVGWQGTMTPACNKHDMCYICGKHYKWTRSQCDSAFLRDMKEACGKVRAGWLFNRPRADCNRWPHVYYNAVRLGGRKNWDKDYCIESCSWRS